MRELWICAPIKIGYTNHILNSRRLVLLRNWEPCEEYGNQTENTHTHTKPVCLQPNLPRECENIYNSKSQKNKMKRKMKKHRILKQNGFPIYSNGIQSHGTFATITQTHTHTHKLYLFKIEWARALHSLFTHTDWVCRSIYILNLLKQRNHLKVIYYFALSSQRTHWRSRSECFASNVYCSSSLEMRIT